MTWPGKLCSDLFQKTEIIVIFEQRHKDTGMCCAMYQPCALIANQANQAIWEQGPVCFTRTSACLKTQKSPSRGLSSLLSKVQHGKFNTLLHWESFDVRRFLQITARCLFSISHFLTKKDVFVVHVGLFQQRFKDLLCTGQNTSPRMHLE